MSKKELFRNRKETAMKLMHTKTPDFVQKMHNAVNKGTPGMSITIKGMEGLESGKWASIKTGQIEELCVEMAKEEGIEHLEMVIMEDSPEVKKTVLVKAVNEDGSIKKIVRCQNIYVFVPSEEIEYGDCEDIVTHQTY